MILRRKKGFKFYDERTQLADPETFRPENFLTLTFKPEKFETPKFLNLYS